MPGMAEEFDSAQSQPLIEPGLQLQDCCAELDQAALETLRVEGESVATRIHALCEAGQQQEARVAALVFGQQLAQPPLWLQARHCGAAIELLVPALAALTAGESDPIDVCAMQ